MDYAVLNAMPAESFLRPELFATSYDKADAYGFEQYAKGLSIAHEWDEVYISSNGTWGARKDKQEGVHGDMWMSVCTSHEGIGYHKNTADLLAGLLAGKAPVYVDRFTTAGSGIVSTQIK